MILQIQGPIAQKLTTVASKTLSRYSVNLVSHPNFINSDMYTEHICACVGFAKAHPTDTSSLVYYMWGEGACTRHYNIVSQS